MSGLRDDEDSWICKMKHRYDFDATAAHSRLPAKINVGSMPSCGSKSVAVSTKRRDAKGDYTVSSFEEISHISSSRYTDEGGFQDKFSSNRGDTIPHIIHVNQLPTGHHEESAEFDYTYELAQECLAEGMKDALQLMESLEQETELLQLAKGHSMSDIGISLGMLHTLIEHVHMSHSFRGETLQKLLDLAPTAKLCTEVTLSLYCRVAYFTQVLVEFLQQYTINKKSAYNHKKKLSSLNGVRCQWSIESETVLVTLLELLDHGFGEIVSVLGQSTSNLHKRENDTCAKVKISLRIQRLLEACSHNQELETILLSRESESKRHGSDMKAFSDLKDNHMGNIIFWQVCSDILLRMEQYCPAASQAIVNLHNDDPNFWGGFLKGQMLKTNAPIGESIQGTSRQEIRNESWYDDYFRRSRICRHVPEEALEVLNKVQGPLLQRPEALKQVIRRILPEHHDVQNACQDSLSGVDATSMSVRDGLSSLNIANCKRMVAIADFRQTLPISELTGFGKTTLAALVIQYPEVRNFYTDGIIWLSFERVFDEKMSYAQYRKYLKSVLHQMEHFSSGHVEDKETKKNFAHVLDFVTAFDMRSEYDIDETQPKSSNLHEVGFMTQAYSLMAELLQNKKVLLVLDNISGCEAWETLSWFRFSARLTRAGLNDKRASPRLHTGFFSIIATTRNYDLLPAASTVELDRLSIDEAMKLIGPDSLYLPQTSLSETMKAIAYVCSCHPFVLSCVRRFLDYYCTGSDEGCFRPQKVGAYSSTQLFNALITKNIDSKESSNQNKLSWRTAYQVLNYTLRPCDLLNDSGISRASSIRLKLSLVAFVVVFEGVSSRQEAARVPLTVLDSLFYCVFDVEMVTDDDQSATDEAIHVRELLLELGFFFLSTKKDDTQTTMKSTREPYVKITHSRYLDFAHFLIRHDITISSFLDQKFSQRWNESFAKFLFCSVTNPHSTVRLDDITACDYKQWETYSDSNSLLEYALNMLPTHLLNAGLYWDTIDLLGCSQFVYDRLHYYSTTGSLEQITEKQIEDVLNLMSILPTSWDKKAILKRVMLLYGCQLVQLLEENVCLNIDSGVEEKKIEEVIAKPNRDLRQSEQTMQVALAFLRLGDALMLQQAYELSIRFWLSSIDALDAYYGTRRVEIVAAILCKIGDVYREYLDNAEEALVYLTDCLSIRRNLHGEKHILSAQALRSLCQSFLKTGAFDDAETGISLALDMLRDKPRLHREEVGKLQKYMGLLHFRHASYNLALDCLTKSLLCHSAEFGGESCKLITIHEQIAKCHWELEDKESSIKSLEHALTLALKMDTHSDALYLDKEKDAKIACLKGFLERLGCRTTQSLTFYNESLSLYQGLLGSTLDDNPRSEMLNEQIAVIFHEIGLSNFMAAKHTEALRNFEESLDRRRTQSKLGYKMGNILEVAETLSLMSTVYEKQGHLVKALRNLGEALKIRDTYASGSEILARTHLQIAAVAQIQRDVAKARQSLESALEIRKKLYSCDLEHNLVATITQKLNRLKDEEI